MEPDAQSFDHVAEAYDRLAELTDDPVARWLPEVLPEKSGRALELGCGTGRHTVLLAERFREVDALDLSGPMIDLARRRRSRPNVAYRRADLLDAVGEHDFVLSVATLHHLPDLRAALEHIRTLAAPGGTIVLVDTVSSRPSVPRWRLHGVAARKLLDDLASKGPATAWETYRLRTGAWLDHRVSDRYLSRERFDQVYGEAFPGGRLLSVGRAQALVWASPPRTIASAG